MGINGFMSEINGVAAIGIGFCVAFVYTNLVIHIIHTLHQEVPGLYSPVAAFGGGERDFQILVGGKFETAQAIDVIGSAPAFLVRHKRERREKTVNREWCCHRRSPCGMLDEGGHDSDAARKFIIIKR